MYDLKISNVQLPAVVGAGAEPEEKLIVSVPQHCSQVGSALSASFFPLNLHTLPQVPKLFSSIVTFSFLHFP